MLTLRGVSKSYNGQVVLSATDIAVQTQRTTVLIGPSGSGKSTLLRLMLGLIVPDRGQVSVGDDVLTNENALRLRRRMGYVIQDGGLFPHLTAFDNIAVMARYLGWSAERAEERVAELSRLTQFPSDGLVRYPAQLSGGQRQRVSLMRALMLDPDVLLLDEPLAALDPIIRSELQNDLKQIFGTLGKTVVMVTHDLAEAAFFGHTIVLLRDGQIVQQGSLEDLVQHPANSFVKRFVTAQRTIHGGLAE